MNIHLGKVGRSKHSMVTINKVAGRPPASQNAKLSPAQEAHHITFTLLGFLKRASLHFLIIGAKLAEFRDKKRYEDLQYTTIDSYAEERLGLGHTSLHHYLDIYDWVLEKHSAWLAPKPSGHIPDFSDAPVLMWIEKKLENNRLSDQMRAELEAMDKKGLEGRLTKKELDDFRRRHRNADGLKPFLSSLRALRRRGEGLTGMPSGAISDLNSAIDKIQCAINTIRSKHRNF